MARERPLDMVEMHIVKGGEDTGTDAVRAKIESLGIGVLVRVERTCTHGPVVVWHGGVQMGSGGICRIFPNVERLRRGGTDPPRAAGRADDDGE